MREVALVEGRELGTVPGQDKLHYSSAIFVPLTVPDLATGTRCYPPLQPPHAWCHLQVFVCLSHVGPLQYHDRGVEVERRSIIPSLLTPHHCHHHH
ncbi:hypothetical protein Pcinc_042552 [Petrolisthes cinctipes]|uniref:Uncharacterized protein n=1 Tax=Petrolisthes cinctipes TaxID=88211 RepID=A0AAE1BH95_PETCI|nr:hypothetical protein Pcinc_042552 [Petrolisthes cinctipes]